MNENLLVNSKTDILEFKRKHNLLVGKGTIKTTVSNIKQMTNADIENLSCGDVVLKEDASGKHAYLVSFKSDTGLCLTYCDASCVETQSYDKVGDNWQYNSQDLTYIAEPRLENIVDKELHKRFIEDDGVATELEGYTPTFVKWSLSGSHLMLVVAGNIALGTTIANNFIFAKFTLPKWIFDKVYPVWSGANIETKTIAFVSDDWASQSLSCILQKPNVAPYENMLIIRMVSSAHTFTANRGFRCAFDLLIDNE